MAAARDWMIRIVLVKSHLFREAGDTVPRNWFG